MANLIHNMKKKALVAVVVGAFSLPAYAIFTVVSAPDVVAAVGALTGAVSAGFATLGAQVEWVKQILDAGSDKTANAINNAIQAQGKNNANVLRENQIQGIEANSRPPIDPCANASRGLSAPDFGFKTPGSSGGSFSPRMGGGPGSGGGKARPSTGSAKLDEAIKIANGEKPAPSPETQALINQAGACATYADGDANGQGVRIEACKNAGTNVQRLAGLPNADIRAQTLFTGAQSGAEASKVSWTWSDKQIAATEAYLKNISNPIQLRELSPIEARTENGRAYFALRDAYMARVDLALYPSKDWQSNMTPDKDTIAIVKAMKDGGGAAAQYIDKVFTKQVPTWATTGISHHQLMKLESDRRFGNPDYIIEIAKQTDALSLQREQLMVSTQLADLMTKQLLQQERNAILLGSIYQATLNRDFMPDLLAAHKKAASSR